MVVFVTDIAEIVCGAILLHMTHILLFMWSKIAPCDKMVVMWSNDKLLHISDMEQFVITPHDKFTMYVCSLIMIYAVLTQHPFYVIYILL